MRVSQEGVTGSLAGVGDGVFGGFASVFRSVFGGFASLFGSVFASVFRSVFAGAVLWLVWAALVIPARTPLILTFAPLVIVPLGLAVAARPANGPTTPLLDRLTRWSTVVSLSVPACFTVDVGWAAALLATPWLLFTVAVAGVGAARLLSRPSLAHPGVAVDAALLFLVVGGSWLVISRAGLTPMGFDAAIVQLTAVHFHYAGFALPIIAGAVAQRERWGSSVPVAVVGGVPLTALGITLGGVTEWVGATIMALAGLATALMVTGAARRVSGPARPLLVVAAGSLAVGMALAIGWAWSRWFGWSYLDLDGMVATHGVLNGFGFGLLGLLALNLMADDGPDRDVSPQGGVCLYLGRPSVERLKALQADAVGHRTTSRQGLLGRGRPSGYRRQVWRRSIVHDDFDRAADGVRAWAGHRRAGINRWPERPPIEVGETLAMCIPAGPLGVTATARIIDVVDEPERFGFTYSTLPHHPVDGEESFVVARNEDGELEIVVTAVWRGAVVANDLVPPLTRYLQNGAIGRYLDGIAAHGSEVGRSAETGDRR